MYFLKRMNWYYCDKGLKACFNLLLVLVANAVLGKNDFYLLITTLSLFYVSYAISSMGLESLVFGLVKREKTSYGTLKVILQARLLSSLFTSLLYIIVSYTGYGIESLVIMTSVLVTLIVKSLDAFEFIMLSHSQHSKNKYSKASLIAGLIFFILKLLSLKGNNVNLFFIFLFLENLLMNALCMFWGREYLLRLENAYVQKKDLLHLYINSIVGMAVTRFDQICAGYYINQEAISLYMLLIRFFEPILTIVQVHSSNKLSSSSGFHEHTGDVFAYIKSIFPFVLAYLIIISTSYIVYMGLYGEARIFFLLSCLYLMNCFRVVLGKALLVNELKKELLKRTFFGFAILAVLSVSVTDLTLIQFIILVILPIIAMNALSVYYLRRNQ